MRQVLIIILFVILALCLISMIICGILIVKQNLHKIKYIVFKNIYGEIKTLYSYNLYKIIKVEIIDFFDNSKILADVTKKVEGKYYVSKELNCKKAEVVYNSRLTNLKDIVFKNEIIFSNLHESRISFKIYVKKISNVCLLVAKNTKNFCKISFFKGEGVFSKKALRNENILIPQKDININYY